MFGKKSSKRVQQWSQAGAQLGMGMGVLGAMNTTPGASPIQNIEGMAVGGIVGGISGGIMGAGLGMMMDAGEGMTNTVKKQPKLKSKKQMNFLDFPNTVNI